MAYQIEDQNGVQPENGRIWEEAIAAFEKDLASFEFEGRIVAIEEVHRNDTHTRIVICLDGE